MTTSTESARRRTHAIISHPDAGKTTLTEKLLLYSGAIHMAGSVRARKTSRHAVSDWMEMEKTRGISITSSVLQFEYQGAMLNLLDTPGHADFSEDTYRTLAAVDSAVMLIDHTKGVESRTLKLFDVCRMRGLPVVSFMNKLDRNGLDPLSLIDEIAKTLRLKVSPLNWPVGMGPSFCGVVDVRTRALTLFADGDHGQFIAKSMQIPFSEARQELGERLHDQVSEQLDLLEIAGEPWDKQAFLEGELTPILWGSASRNFGIEPLLNYLAQHAAPPMARGYRNLSGESKTLAPDDQDFSGFVFKIQANMNPRHRDRVAFIRVVSGQFRRGMEVTLARTGETLRMTKPHTFMAQERSIVEDAWPGDIVGLYDPGNLRIGDTLREGPAIKFEGIPRFAPEKLMRTVLKDPLKRKQLYSGIDQLAHEGVIQAFYRPAMGRQDPWLGAVGALQFEVLKQRLLNEYGVSLDLEPLPYSCARWIGGSPKALEWLKQRRDYVEVVDRNDQPVLLSETPWSAQYVADNAPGIELYDVEPI